MSIAMRFLLIILLIPLSGCWNADSLEARRQETLRKLDTLEAIEHGELIRARADCQAIAIEAPGALEDCLHALRIQTELSRQTLERIAQRRKELGAH